MSNHPAESTADHHQSPAKYHHGRSPAAWSGVIIALVGFALLGFAVLTGPNWPLIIVSGVIFVIALVVTRVLQVMGLGNA